MSFPDTTRRDAVITALYWREHTLEELAEARDMTTAGVFHVLREAIAHGWVEPLDRADRNGRTRRLFRLTPDGCVHFAALLRAPREP